MIDTLKMLRPFVDESLKNVSLNNLALMYQPSRNCSILASAYERIYKLAINISNKFWGLDCSDVASYCLEKLDFCLMTYNGNGEFSTYFYVVFHNKLREETEKLNYKKRKCILQSINEIINIGVEDTYNLLELMLPSNLSKREYELCLLEAEGYDRKYCAEKLGVSRQQIHNIEVGLRNKLSYL